PCLTALTNFFPQLNFDLDRGVFPVVIHAVVDEGDVVEVTGHAHVLLAAFEKVDRVSYLLQEIYGIENKNNQETKLSDEENSDNSNECVVCLSDLRDTLILPCRHLCLCNSCADTLRYQASSCPICRLPFRALLQIRAVRKKPGALSPISFSPVLAQSVDPDEHSSSDSIPPGYEPISLLEALNGLRAISPAIPSAPLYEEITYSGISDGLSQASCPLAGLDRIMESSHQKGKPRTKSPDRPPRGSKPRGTCHICPGEWFESGFLDFGGLSVDTPCCEPSDGDPPGHGGTSTRMELVCDVELLCDGSLFTDTALRSPSSPIHEEEEEKLSQDLEALPLQGGVGLALSSSPESLVTEEVDESSSLKQGSRASSIENVLQDGSPEPCRGPPGPSADIYLPALGPDSCSVGIEE
ncbi:hypothetical protein MC885_008920, partial [Smutsia gigantea]